MNTQRQWRAAVLVVLIAQCGPIAVHAASPYPVAGLAPHQRPVNAPALKSDPVLDAKRALHGVSAPIPDSLKFLDVQGGWFTPFTHPGMTGPYDLRGWHPVPLPAAEKK